jgi:hypothetical protein
MPSSKTITYSLPADLGRELAQRAKAEHLTVNELVREAVRQYSALRAYKVASAEARKLVREKGLTEKDFGGPFAK